jgi:hypothetical protein
LGLLLPFPRFLLNLRALVALGMVGLQLFGQLALGFAQLLPQGGDQVLALTGSGRLSAQFELGRRLRAH